ncbi:hypothetical protein BY458DRAFT_490891 [Sporodiniella umbellata]|nr:hypothetical protein BY458DRAFT_490891 [Sporodiniella umbellata]
MLRQTSHLKNRILNRYSAQFSSKASSWFARFITPEEEKELYLGITSMFREKLIKQGDKSTQNYSTIIEHALFARPTPIAQSSMEKFVQDIDNADKDTLKLQQIEKEMFLQQVQIPTIYNRLVRSYLQSDALPLAEKLVDRFDSRGIFATTRTYTYLLQTYLKQNQLEKAAQTVETMKSLNLLKLRHAFDCSVVLEFYKTSGNTHACEFLWRDIMLHIDIIRPGLKLYTQYLEYLLDNQQPLKTFVNNYLGRNETATLTHSQYTLWITAAQRLLSSKDMTEAEHLLLYLIKSAHLGSNRWSQKAKKCMNNVLTSYIYHGQDLKLISFYYRARKAGAPDQLFEPDALKEIESAVEKLQSNPCNQDHQAILEEFARPLKL